MICILLDLNRFWIFFYEWDESILDGFLHLRGNHMMNCRLMNEKTQFIAFYGTQTRPVVFNTIETSIEFYYK